MLIPVSDAETEVWQNALRLKSPPF